MRRYKIKGRFYLFLAILLGIVFLIVRPYLSFGEKVEAIGMASSAYTHTMDAVLIRDERLTTADSVARIEYAAPENTLVYEGGTVAYLYSTGYSQTELEKLETVRENIQAYHKLKLENIIDTNLERLDLIVDQRALEFKNLVTHKSDGNLIIMNRLLETAMVNRQEYMRSNMRNDMKLNNLYSQENARLSSIASWRVESTAEKEGVVSFYTDGYERFLNGDTIQSLTVSQVQKVLSDSPWGDFRPGKGRLPAGEPEPVVCGHFVRRGQLDPGDRPGLLHAVRGLRGSGLFRSGCARSLRKAARCWRCLKSTRPWGALIYQRTARAGVSITLTGLSVSTDAIYDQNGQTGVWLKDVPGGTFVPVTVLFTDGNKAMIQPVVEGALSLGQQVLIK